MPENHLQYIGARYVPLFADPVEWQPNLAYEPLTIVTRLNSSFTSRKDVPVGMAPETHPEYWALTGNYNAQVEQYRKEVAAIAGEIESFEQEIDTKVEDQQKAVNEVKADIAKVNRNMTRVNIASVVESLTSDNFQEALTSALAISKYIYIPSGNWDIATTITADCDILLSPDARISVKTVGTPAILFKNCNVLVKGGRFEYTGTGSTFPTSTQSSAIIEFETCPSVEVCYTVTGHCDYTGVFQFLNCERVHVHHCSFADILFWALHCLADNNINGMQTKLYLVEYCKVDGVKIPTNPDVYYSYFSYTGVRNIGQSEINRNSVPPDTVIYRGNYCVNCQDSTLDCHGARIMIAEYNTCINCNTAITLYNDQRRVSRPDGWICEQTIVRGNYCTSDYYNGLGQHPAFILGNSGPCSEFELLENNTFINTKNSMQRAGLWVDNIKQVRIVNCHFSFPANRYALGSRCNDLVKIENCTIDPGTTGKSILLNGGALELDDNTRFSNWDYIAGSINLFCGVAMTNYVMQLVRGGQVRTGSNNALYYTANNGLFLSASQSGSEFPVTLSGGRVSGVHLPRGTRIQLVGGGNTYQAASKNVVAVDTMDIQSSSAIPDGSYTLTIVPETRLVITAAVG